MQGAADAYLEAKELPEKLVEPLRWTTSFDIENHDDDELHLHAPACKAVGKKRPTRDEEAAGDAADLADAEYSD